MANMITVAVSLTPETLKIVDELAKEIDSSRSQAMRMIIKKYKKEDK